jgi:hypothetical protein
MLGHSIDFELPAHIFVKSGEAFIRHIFDAHIRSWSSQSYSFEGGSQRGGFNSPASQPVASVFKGSTAKQTFST